MCGITGWIDFSADLTGRRDVLAAMTETLACRGPDAVGMWWSAHAALGHRRLSVIDPERGAQPMIRRRGERTWVITYNGELYNAWELRRALEARGWQFETTCDTEILLVAFMEWGADCVPRLNGIFAFGVWDSGTQSLFLARDRLGVKPLFYTRRGESFLFASELKALLAHPAVEPELDAEGLAEVFALGPARTPGHGVLRGVLEVKPGWWLRYDADGMRHHQYWALESRPHDDDPEATVGMVRRLFEDTVQRQLVSDVPICTLLSGGLDSSAITAVAARHAEASGRGPLDTYSIDYRDNERHFRPDDFQPDADAPWVRRVSGFLGTRHHPVVIDTPELVESLRVAVRARDLPGMADIDGSLFLFCREIKKGATVALSGECADEVFGGYPWFRRRDALDADTFPWSLKLGERLKVLSPGLQDAIRPAEYVAARYEEALAEVPRPAGEDPHEARLRKIGYLTLTRWMPVLLDRKDRMSMAVGLEVRVPYCDHRLVEYVWNVPWAIKYAEEREKGLLRKALTGLLPGDVLWRRKSPFPKTHNPAYVAAVRHWILRILDDRSSPLLPLVDRTAVRELAMAERDFDVPWFGQLMRGPQLLAYLIQVDLWLREYRVRIV